MPLVSGIPFIINPIKDDIYREIAASIVYFKKENGIFTGISCKICHWFFFLGRGRVLKNYY